MEDRNGVPCASVPPHVLVIGPALIVVTIINVSALWWAGLPRILAQAGMWGGAAAWLAVAAYAWRNDSDSEDRALAAHIAPALLALRLAMAGVAVLAIAGIFIPPLAQGALWTDAVLGSVFSFGFMLYIAPYSASLR